MQIDSNDLCSSRQQEYQVKNVETDPGTRLLGQRSQRVATSTWQAGDGHFCYRGWQ